MNMATALVAAGMTLELLTRLYRSRRDRVSIASLFWRQPSAKIHSFIPHPYAFYVKRPGRGGSYPTNSMGHVGKREYAKSRSPQSFRIYCVGASEIENIVPEQGPDSSWPGKLQDVLTQRFPGVKIECLNAGASGYTSAESLAEFLFRGVDFRPDLLLVYHNGNDAATCQMVNGFASDYSHARRPKPWTEGWLNRLPQVTWLWSYQLLREWATKRYGKIHTLLHWISDPPWQAAHGFKSEAVKAFERNIINLVAVAQAWNCRSVLIKWECDWQARRAPLYFKPSAETTELYYAFVQANNEALRRVAQRFDACRYIDVGPMAPQHFCDTNHFSPSGLDEMARRVADQIEPVVKDLIGLQTRRPEALAMASDSSG